MQNKAPVDKIIAELDGSSDSVEKRQLKEWREESEENQLFYKAFSIIWNNSDKQGFTPNTEKSLNKVHYRINRRKFTRIASSAAAILILAILVGGLAGLFITPSNQVQVIAKHQQTIILPDSTEVILSEGAVVLYPAQFNVSKRAITLKGKAYFNVTKDSKRPFIISSEHGTTKVLGTQFTLEDNGHQTASVYLDEGSVSFKPKGIFKRAQTLKPGEKISYADGKYSITQLNNLNASAWATQQLTFKNTPLIQVVKELNAFYNANIQLQTNKISQLRFSGKIKENDANAALEIIALTLNLNIKVSDKNLILSL